MRYTLAVIVSLVVLACSDLDDPADAVGADPETRETDPSTGSIDAALDMLDASLTRDSSAVDGARAPAIFFSTGTGTLDARGGTISDGVVTLYVPPGALDGELSITIEQSDASVGDAFGGTWRITPTATLFNVPALLTIAYPRQSLAGLSPYELTISRADGMGWLPLVMFDVNTTLATLSTPIDELGTFRLAAKPALTADVPGADSGSESGVFVDTASAQDASSGPETDAAQDTGALADADVAADAAADTEAADANAATDADAETPADDAADSAAAPTAEPSAPVTPAIVEPTPPPMAPPEPVSPPATAPEPPAESITPDVPATPATDPIAPVMPAPVAPAMTEPMVPTVPAPAAPATPPAPEPMVPMMPTPVTPVMPAPPEPPEPSPPAPVNDCSAHPCGAHQTCQGSACVCDQGWGAGANGACVKECTAAHQVTTSDGQDCICDPRWLNCDGSNPDCEVPARSDQNCGACGNVCDHVSERSCSETSTGFACMPVSHAQPCDLLDCGTGATCKYTGNSMACVCDGTNQVFDPETRNCVCAHGWQECAGSPGCTTSITSDSHCGSCDLACDATAEGHCLSPGVCMTSAAFCNQGYLDCDGKLGCETAGDTDENCGACGVACDAAMDSHCLPDESGDFSCAVASTIQCSADSCPAGAECTNTSSGPVCSCSGTHQVLSDDPKSCTCELGWLDCDGQPGCESSATTDLHCGACGTICDVSAESHCVGGGGQPHCETVDQCAGIVCPGGGVCQDGVCKCPPGTIGFGGECVTPVPVDEPVDPEPTPIEPTPIVPTPIVPTPIVPTPIVPFIPTTPITPIAPTPTSDGGTPLPF